MKLSTETAGRPGNFEESPAVLTTCFIVIFLAGFALRLHAIAVKPFWMDEVTTIRRASLPLGPLVTDSLFFHQLPAFFVVTSWVLPFGTDEFWVRLPPAFFGALSCALGFGLGRCIGGLKAGVAAGLLIALSPEMVQYGQEARSYTLLICAILVALWGLVVLAQDLAKATLPWRGGGQIWAWTAYVAGTVAALNILSGALFWFLAANLAGGTLAWQRKGAFGRRWVLAQIIIIVICLPWFVAIKFLGQRGTFGGLDWVPPLTWARIWWAFSGTYLLYVTSLIKVRVFAPGVAGLGILVAALAAAGVVALRRQRAVLGVLVISMLILPVGLLAISVITPILMPRYLLWSAAPYFICAGIGFTILPRRLQWPAVAVFGLLLAINLSPYYREETKPRWDLAGAELHAGLKRGDLVLVDDPQAVSMMNIYLKRQGAALPSAIWTTNLSEAVAWHEEGRRVWAVQGLVGQVDHENQAQFLRRIAALGMPQLSERVGMDILLLRFDGVAASD